MLASVSKDLRIYDCHTDPPELRFRARCGDFQDDLGCISWNHTGQVVAVAGTKAQISLVQSSNGQTLSTIPFNAEESFQGSVKSVCFSNNSRYITTSTYNLLKIWDLKRRNLKATLGQGNRGNITCVNMVSTGDLVAGDDNGMIRIWDVKVGASHQDIMVLPGYDDNTSPIGVSVTKVSEVNTTRIAAGYNDGQFALWNYETSQCLRRQRIHSTNISGLEFSPKNTRLVATCGYDGKVALVDTVSKSNSYPSALIEVKNDQLTCVSFHQDAIHFVVGTMSGSLLLYDWRNTQQPLFELLAHSPHAVRAASFFQVPYTSSSASNTPSKTLTPRRMVPASDRPQAMMKTPSSTTKNNMRMVAHQEIGGMYRSNDGHGGVDLSASIDSTMSSLSSTTAKNHPQQQYGSKHNAYHESRNNNTYNTNAITPTKQGGYAPARMDTSQQSLPPPPPSNNTISIEYALPPNVQQTAHDQMDEDANSHHSNHSKRSARSTMSALSASTIASTQKKAQEILHKTQQQLADSKATLAASRGEQATTDPSMDHHSNPFAHNKVYAASPINVPVTTTGQHVVDDNNPFTEYQAQELRELTNAILEDSTNQSLDQSVDEMVSKVSNVDGAMDMSVKSDLNSRADEALNYHYSSLRGKMSATPSKPNEQESSYYRQSIAMEENSNAVPSSSSPIQGVNAPAIGDNNNNNNNADTDFSALQKTLDGVSSQEFQESLQLLRYDIHKDVQSIMTEQARQFSMSKQDMSVMIDSLRQQLNEVLEANKQLRLENERLRHIY